MILIQDRLGDGFRELKSIAGNDVPEMPKDSMQRGKIREMESPTVRRKFADQLMCERAKQLSEHIAHKYGCINDCQELRGELERFAVECWSDTQ